jgi:hypothetical protein
LRAVGQTPVTPLPSIICKELHCNQLLTAKPMPYPVEKQATYFQRRGGGGGVSQWLTYAVTSCPAEPGATHRLCAPSPIAGHPIPRPERSRNPALTWESKEANASLPRASAPPQAPRRGWMRIATGATRGTPLQRRGQSGREGAPPRRGKNRASGRRIPGSRACNRRFVYDGSASTPTRLNPVICGSGTPVQAASSLSPWAKDSRSPASKLAGE